MKLDYSQAGSIKIDMVNSLRAWLNHSHPSFLEEQKFQHHSMKSYLQLMSKVKSPKLSKENKDGFIQTAQGLFACK